MIAAKPRRMLTKGHDTTEAKIMVSPDPNMTRAGGWPGRVVTYRDFASDLARRREALGKPDVPRNSGDRRTASKKALLKALYQLDAKW